MNSGIKAGGFLDSDTNSTHVDFGTTLTFNCSTPGETVIVGTQVISCEKSTYDLWPRKIEPQTQFPKQNYIT